ncbi:NUDIX hydrolase YfcD [Thermodesulfobacteriota bacterium]
MDSDHEIITIVDEQNRVIDAVPRHEMRAKGLIHRATYILVFNSAEQLFVQKRTLTKDIYPGHYDIAAGGVVLAGESYEVSARRELAEELGIDGVDLQILFDTFYDGDDNKVWGRVFSCNYDGRMVLQEEEVESGQFMSLKEVHELAEHQPFTPDGLEILKQVKLVSH